MVVGFLVDDCFVFGLCVTSIFVSEACDSVKIHGNGAAVSLGALSVAVEGDPPVSSGLNGVGKLISTGTAIISANLSVG